MFIDVIKKSFPGGVWAVDSEFRLDTSKTIPDHVVCFVYKNIFTGETLRFWEDDKKFWVEYKFDSDGEHYPGSMSKLEEVIGKDYLTYSSPLELKKLQGWIWENYTESFLTYQIYCSLVLKMQFCAGAGASSMLSFIPQINLFSAYDFCYNVLKMREFKKKIR